MSQQHTEAEAETPPLDERAVADYLREHPEFFTRHRRLAAEIEVPHDAGGAISLVSYQLHRLREEKRRLRWRLDELLGVARDNDRVAEQLHRLTLDLLEADGLDDALMAVRDRLRADFLADVVSIRLVGDSLPDVAVDVLASDDPDVARLPEQFRGGRPAVGRLSAEQIRLAFGEQGGEIRSAAVIPLVDTALRGVIGIGSFDAERFSGDQGTIFLGRLGDLVGCVLGGRLAERDG